MPHPIQDRGRYRTQYEPRSAAWSIDYGEFPTEHYGKCKEEGCKLAFRHHISENRTEEELSKHGRLDELVDFVPSGVDREGNEVSFKVWEALPCGREDDASERQVLPDCEDHMERYRAWFEEKTRMEGGTLTLDPEVSSVTKKRQPTWSSTLPASTVGKGTASTETQFRLKK